MKANEVAQLVERFMRGEMTEPQRLDFLEKLAGQPSLRQALAAWTDHKSNQIGQSWEQIRSSPKLETYRLFIENMWHSGLNKPLMPYPMEDKDRQEMEVFWSNVEAIFIKMIHAHWRGNEVEEAAHDIFTEAYLNAFTLRQQGHYEERGLFDHFFMRIAWGISVAKLRAKGRQANLTFEGLFPEMSLVDAAPENEEDLQALFPDEASFDDERLDGLERCLQGLSPENQVIFQKVYVEQIVIKEVAEQLGMPYNTMRQRLFSIRNMLRKCLKKGKDKQ